ncbi:MAG: hypothetical protein ACWGMZ_08890 [Thermoguttaceae bacterium]
MTPEQIKSIVETTISDATPGYWLILVYIIIPLVSAYLGGYFGNKGKNLATKQDIEDLTRQVETVKQEIRNQDAISTAKRQMKYEACLEALAIVDAFFSQIGWTDLTPVKQIADTARAREAHNKLILSCDDSEIVKLYMEILCGPTSGEDIAPTDKLNNFRNAIRKELGFGNDIELDRKQAWIALLTGDQNSPQQATKK